MKLLEIELNEDQMNTIAEKAAEKAVGMLEERSLKLSGDKEKLYTVKQVAGLTHVDPWTIRNHIKIGLLKAAKTGKSWLINQAQLEEYTNQNKTE